ncbi:MAG: TRAP transporter small permease [Myxococcales bacterium]|nr:TRAP transporter small permease [Myxococcales bacterium]
MANDPAPPDPEAPEPGTTDPADTAPAGPEPAAGTSAPRPATLPPATAVAGVAHEGEPPLARKLRMVDEGVGSGERVVIALLFAFLVAIGFYRTFADLIWNKRPLWAVEGIRVSVFAIAMLGAAFATHHKRNFSLDLVSRAFAPRGRAVLRVLLNLVALTAATLLLYGGWLVKKAISAEKHYELVPKWVIGWFIPIAAALIIVHLVLHTVIELAYLGRGQTAPEPEQAVG